MSTNSLTTPAEASIYDEPSGGTGQFRIAEIRASGGMSDTKVEQGHLYLRDFNVPQGEDPVDVDLGTKAEIIILRDAKRLQYYESDLKRTMIDSTEFRSWDDQIVLFQYIEDSEGKHQPHMVAVLPYTSQSNGLCMKDFKEKRFPNRVRMKYRAYALLKTDTQDQPWRIVSINLSNADMVGMDKDSNPKFENPDEDSFDTCKHSIYKDASKKQMFNHKVTIGTFRVDNRIMRKTFVVIDRLEEGMRDTVTQALHELYAMLEIQMKKKIERAVEHTDLKKVVSLNPQYIEDIQMDQKPLLSIARYEKHPDVIPGKTDFVPRKLLGTVSSPQDVDDVFSEPENEKPEPPKESAEKKEEDGGSRGEEEEAASETGKLFGSGKKGNLAGKKKP
jgi:hypothetical protein